MLNFTKRSWIIIIAAVLLAAILGAGFAANRASEGEIPANALQLPAVGSISSMEILPLDDGSWGDLVTTADKEVIQSAYNGLASAKKTARQSVNDVPNVSAAFKVTFNNADESPFYVYTSNSEYLVEIPYMGIYRIDTSVYSEISSIHPKLMLKLESDKTQAPEPAPSHSPFLSSWTPLEALPADITLEQAIDEHIFISIHGQEYYNTQQLSYFIECVENGIPAFVRTMLYTIEGDPVITDYQYNGESFSVTRDATRDKFGARSIETLEFKYLVSYMPPDNSGYTGAETLRVFSDKPVITDADWEEVGFYALPALPVETQATGQPQAALNNAVAQTSTTNATIANMPIDLTFIKPEAPIIDQLNNSSYRALYMDSDTLVRVTRTGVVQVSFDNGAVWADYETDDISAEYMSEWIAKNDPIPDGVTMKAKLEKINNGAKISHAAFDGGKEMYIIFDGSEAQIELSTPTKLNAVLIDGSSMIITFDGLFNNQAPQDSTQLHHKVSPQLLRSFYYLMVTNGILTTAEAEQDYNERMRYLEENGFVGNADSLDGDSYYWSNALVNEASFTHGFEIKDAAHRYGKIIFLNAGSVDVAVRVYRPDGEQAVSKIIAPGAIGSDATLDFSVPAFGGTGTYSMTIQNGGAENIQGTLSLKTSAGVIQ